MGIVSGERIMEHCVTNVIPPIENKKQKIRKHSDVNCDFGAV